MMKNKIKRIDGINIIKVIAIIFVPFLHYYNNFNFSDLNMVGMSSIIKIGIRWLCFSCIGLFIMSSGFLLSNKKVSKKYYLKSIKFFVLYFIFLLITQLYNNGFTTNFFIELMKRFFTFPAYFWYVAFYLVLYYLIPYLNIISEKLTKKEYNIFLITLVLLINVPEFYNSFPSYYGNEKIFYFMNPFNTLYPFVYYYIGAYIKKFNPDFSKRKSCFILILTILIISCIDYTYSKGSQAMFYGGGYGSIISIIISTCIFNIFYNINIKNKFISRTINFAASITFETYLALALSDRFTDIVISKIANPETMSYKYIILTSFTNFICAFILGTIVHLFIRFITKIFLEDKKDILRQ